MTLTISQAAKLRKVTRNTIHRWIKLGLKATWNINRFEIELDNLMQFTPNKVGRPTTASDKGNEQ